MCQAVQYAPNESGVWYYDETPVANASQPGGPLVPELYPSMACESPETAARGGRGCKARFYPSLQHLVTSEDEETPDVAVSKPSALLHGERSEGK